MNKEAWFIEKCVGLEIGESAVPVHRYKDGWWVFWENATKNNLGRVVKTADDLRKFLAGDYGLGTRIGTDAIWP